MTNASYQLGFGCGTAWYKTGDESKVDKALVEAMTTAIKMGYYHLDGAEGGVVHAHSFSRMLI